MGKYSYRYVEEKHDKEKRNQKKIDELEWVIEGLIEYENESGFTDEQCFLISYYGLDKEKCKNIKFNMNNIIDNINEMKSVPSIPSEKLEENRHEALLDLFFATENFSENKANENKDNFHEIIKDWNQYSEDFEKNPLIIKQMINLQALNRMAHQYQSLFKDMLYRKYPQLDIESSENDIEDMLSSKTDGIRKNAMQKLVLKFGKEQVRKFNKDEYLKFANNYSAKKYENIINVLEYKEEKNRVLVSVDDKNINKFISIVSEYSLDEFSNRKETLEDYFMKFYKEDKDFKGAL